MAATLEPAFLGPDREGDIRRQYQRKIDARLGPGRTGEAGQQAGEEEQQVAHGPILPRRLHGVERAGRGQKRDILR